MKIKRGTYLMAAGTVLLLAALFLLLYNRNEDYQAGEMSTNVLTELKEQMPEAHFETPEDRTFTDLNDYLQKTEIENSNSSDPPEQDLFAEFEREREFNRKRELEENGGSGEVYYYVQNISYMGIISIPRLGIELPVMSDWSYPNLRIAPCRYSGTVADGNMILAAHNYGSHFGRIDRLVSGDEIIFTDGEGVARKYSVIASELIGGYNAAEMVAGDDEWDLTLFTCTYSGASRVTVRAVLEE